MSAFNFGIWWLRQEGMALLVGFAVLGAIVGYVAYYAKEEGMPLSSEIGTVRGFGMGARETGDYPIIIVDSPRGLVIQQRISGRVLRNCKPGNRIAILIHGNTARLSRAGCYE